MDINVPLTVVITVITTALAVMGGLVSVHQPANTKQKQNWQWAFAAVAIIGVSAQITQQVRSGQSSNELMELVKGLRHELREQYKQAPPFVQPKSVQRTPAVRPTLRTPNKEEKAEPQSSTSGMDLMKESLTHANPQTATRIAGSLPEQKLKRYELLGLSESAASLSGSLGTCLVERKSAGDSDAGIVNFCTLYGQFIIELHNRLRNAGREYQELNDGCDAIQKTPKLEDLRGLRRVLDAVALDLGKQASKTRD
jgi:hypothetical protein